MNQDSFVITIDKKTVINKDSITLDQQLRLTALDAFLATLNDVIDGKVNDNLDSKFNYFLARIAKQFVDAEITTIQIEVTSILSPKTNRLTYRFKFDSLQSE